MNMLRVALLIGLLLVASMRAPAAEAALGSEVTDPLEGVYLLGRHQGKHRNAHRVAQSREDLWERLREDHLSDESAPAKPEGPRRLHQEAVDIQWPHWADIFEGAAAERGWARPTMARFRAEIADGSLYLGSPETVATKIAAVIRQLGLSRFDWAYATGRVPHAQRMATIELYGREVVPRVRELLAEPVVEPDSAELSAAAVSTGSNVQH